MHPAGSDLVVSPTDLSGFLACGHLTTLELAEARGGPSHPRYDDPGRELLRELGRRHEAEILEGYRAQGLRVAEPAQPTWEDVGGGWARLAEETLALMRSGADVIYQGGLFDGHWLARPDFLIRTPYVSDLGDWRYEVVDAKLSRAAKVGAVLQICSYSEMVGRVQGVDPLRMHLALGGPREDGTNHLQPFLYNHFAAYYRSVKERFEGVVRAARSPATYPEPCEHCRVCDWAPVCEARWREDDHLSLVAGITRKQRGALEARGVATLEALAGLPLPVAPPLDGVSAPALLKIREQARIQLEGRRDEAPRHEILDHTEPRTGLLALPEPTPGDLFFDIERERHGLREEGLAYLFGYVDAECAFTALWALDAETERRQFEAFVDTVMARLETWPGMHVYHYAPFEPTALKRLAHRHATRENEIDRMLRGGVLVDLHRVVRQGVRAPVESYSIKRLEPFYGFDRAVALRAASRALAHFETWLQLADHAEAAGGRDRGGAGELIRDVEGYNRDDCLSTLLLRDWLEGLRSRLERGMQDEGRLEGPLPRPEPADAEASEEVREEEGEVRALMGALMVGISDDPLERSPEDQARWMLAHLLSWHRREEKSAWWEYFRLRDMDDDERLHDSKALAGLTYEGVVGQEKKSHIHRYRFPAQECAIEKGERKNRDPATGKDAIVWAIDVDRGTLEIKRGRNSKEPHPSSLIPWQYIPTDDQKAALRRLARDVVELGLEGAENRAAIDLLLRRPPRAGQEEGWGFNVDLNTESYVMMARRFVVQLDGTVLPIQGPPGSGKTYVGARMITKLILEGKRVGVMATSHKVIGNLLKDVCKAARELGSVPVRGIQKASAEQAFEHPFIDRTDDNRRVVDALAQGEANLAAGTHWLWSRPEMAGSVDVLIVDEAGQISLANVLAASGAADSIVLLGDPQQLDQPQKGVHPPGTDVSALEYLIGEGPLSAQRGIFLRETWRMHPDVCRFTSQQFYMGQLQSHYDMKRQTVDAPEPFRGTGLRFVPVEHEGNTSDSPEEVEVVAGLVDRLLVSEPMWIDPEGARKPLTLEGILVVAPYNAQVAALRARLPERARVGTVDKFQGQEAPVVIYSTASSSAQDAPRGMKFLYSPNRLNVATSRARCVVVWVGSPRLLAPECRTVEEMGLANGLCALGEAGGSTGEQSGSASGGCSTRVDPQSL